MMNYDEENLLKRNLKMALIGKEATRYHQNAAFHHGINTLIEFTVRHRQLMEQTYTLTENADEAYRQGLIKDMSERKITIDERNKKDSPRLS